MGVIKRSSNPFTMFMKDLLMHGLEAFGRYYSSYRAYVADNEDPDHLNRLQLVIPQINGSELHDYWAYPKHNFSGKNYGSQVLPQKGDVVWVEFEGGNVEVPIWTHGHFAKKERPTDQELNDVNTYWFKTPKGHLVILNDTKNTIRIKSADNDIIEINPKSISLSTPKNISLGQVNKSNEPALLGNKTHDLFETINKVLTDLHGAMLKDVALYTSFGFVNTAKQLPLLAPEIAKLKIEIEKILSNKVTLD